MGSPVSTINMAQEPLRHHPEVLLCALLVFIPDESVYAFIHGASSNPAWDSIGLEEAHCKRKQNHVQGRSSADSYILVY